MVRQGARARRAGALPAVPLPQAAFETKELKGWFGEPPAEVPVEEFIALVS